MHEINKSFFGKEMKKMEMKRKSNQEHTVFYNS